MAFLLSNECFAREREVWVVTAYLQSDRRQHSPAERTRASMAFFSEDGVLSLSFLSPLDV